MVSLRHKPHSSIHTSARTKWKNGTFWPPDETPCNFWQNRHVLKFNLIEYYNFWLILTLGSVVFTGGPFEVELAARPITILSPCYNWIKYNKKRIFLINYLLLIWFCYLNNEVNLFYTRKSPPTTCIWSDIYRGVNRDWN